jgi:hypothetical protein
MSPTAPKNIADNGTILALEPPLQLGWALSTHREPPLVSIGTTRGAVTSMTRSVKPNEPAIAVRLVSASSRAMNAPRRPIEDAAGAPRGARKLSAAETCLSGSRRCRRGGTNGRARGRREARRLSGGAKGTRGAIVIELTVDDPELADELAASDRPHRGCRARCPARRSRAVTPTVDTTIRGESLSDERHVCHEQTGQ